MELYRHFVQFSVFVLTIFGVDAWKCETWRCIMSPLSLKLWKNNIEVSARSLKVKAGSSFSITCDGSCVGSHADPYLSWYGPDKHLIAYEGASNRIHVEHSSSRRFLQLHIHTATVSDQGEYICRGWLGSKRGHDMKSITVLVEPRSEKPVPRTTIADIITTIHSSTANVPIAISSTAIKTTTSPPPATTTTAEPRSEKPVPRTTIADIITTIHSSTANVPIAISSTAIKTTTLPPATTTTAEEEPCFRCGSGECISPKHVCDAFPDCADQLDEQNCPSQECTEDMKACEDGNGCILETQICDGSVDCRDGSDEDMYFCSSRNP